MSGHGPGPASRLGAAAAAAYAYVILGAEMAAIGPLIEGWMREFEVGAAAMGTLFTASSLGSVAMTLAYPGLVARWGLRALLSAGALLVGVGLALAAGAGRASLLLATFGVVGIGFAAVDVGINNLYVVIFPHRRALALNLVHLFFAVGATAAPALLPVLLRVTSWRAIFVAIGAASAAGSLAILMTCRGLTPAVHAGERDGGPGRGAWSLPLLRRLWRPAVAMLLYVGVEVAVTGWAFAYLRWEKAASAELAGAAVSVFWAGLAAGRLLLGAAVEALGYEPTLRLTAIGGGAVLAAMALLPVGPVVALVLLGVVGLVFSVMFPTLVALASRDAPAQESGAVTAVMVLSSTLGSMTLPALTGAAAQWTGQLGATMVAMGAGLALAYVLLIPNRRALAGAVAPAAVAPGAVRPQAER
ncbi:MFS transporter [Carboxydochorda subterranea]|uniref:MFS transporter n=1 Tax=Carboxydichorda subterranea TaxID=3109565 RepID=A0ABZ1BZ93_9FIRM|nr:MFS transporter [Limnochorda sp. L945t]WRP17913.1 MFS transporter [Limnochorda sp. L945t]